jgi:hypothetical protein
MWCWMEHQCFLSKTLHGDFVYLTSNCHVWLVLSTNVYWVNNIFQVWIMQKKTIWSSNACWVNIFFQGLDCGQDSHVVCVIPRGSPDKFNLFNKLGSLSRVNELDLLRAVLAGHLDLSVLVSPSGQYLIFQCTVCLALQFA